MLRRWLPYCLWVLISASAHAVPWMTDWPAALERARTERKLLAVFSTSPECEICGRYETTLAKPAARAAFSHFVPVRLLSNSPLATGGKTPASGLWIFGPDGEVLTALGFPSGPLLDSHLAFYRRAAEPLLAGIALIERGEVYEGRMAKARGLRQLAAVSAATRELEAARAAAHASGRTADAHRATIEMAELLAEEDLRRGAPPIDSEDLLRRMIRDIADPQIRAESYQALATIHRMAGAHAKELAILAEALEQAPRGDDLERVLLDLAGLKGAPGALILLLPPAPLLGEIPVAVAARSSAIERIEIFVDGRRVERVRNRPFTETIDLGPRPSRRRVEARGFDRAGRIVGRHAVDVNLPENFFDVELLPFRNEGSEVVVEALPTAGPGRRVTQIDFHLNGELYSSASRPPYRIRIPRQAYGFVRASATDSAGITREDIAFFDPESVDESFQLKLVEVLVNVEDRSGQPILDLEPGEFRIFESRASRAVRSARQLSSDPRMAAIAIDRSKSLHGLMKEVAGSAVNFAERAVRGGDVFVVGFHHRPEILQWTTNRADAVRRTLEKLEASGNTALNEALIFSLMQFQNSSGNRFLLVLTDGIDTASRYDQKEVTRIANEFGVPIYFVMVESAEGRADPGRLERLRHLAEGTGGRAFDLVSLDQLDAIWTRIQLDVDSRYLVTYHTDLDPSRWRSVEVNTTRRGARVRSIRGLTPSLSQ